MPALTVAVVVHGEQAYVEGCVRSVLDQRFGDLELIVVDDAATGHAPALLDGLEQADERIRVLRVPERVGHAAARALALEHATGDHVWFIAPADRIAPGALAGVAARLRAADADVLIVGHTRHRASGSVRPGPHQRLLGRIEKAGLTTLDAHPALAATGRDAWDKVIRRRLLETVSAPLAPDAGVSWPALLAAERIAAHPEVAYERHLAPNAPGPREDPLTLLTTYDAVFAVGDGVPAARRRLVAGAMSSHVLDRLGGLPAAERAAAFARLADALRRHARGDEPGPAGRVGRLRARLLARGDLRSYEAFETARRGVRSLQARRAALSRQVGRGRRAVRRRRLERGYRRSLRRPIDPDLAVFAAYWYRGYACNPRAIYEKACELVPGMRAVWVVQPGGAAALPAGVEHVVAGTPEYFDVLARARYFVNNVNFPNHLVKRPGSVHVMTHHGTPLKRMGMDLRGTLVAGRKMDFDALLRRCERWDFSVSSNPLSTLVWERVYPTRHETLETGYPRNDALVRATAADVARIRAELGIEPGRTAVLYAPTHREWRSGYVPTLDVGAVAEALGPDHVLLARLHYFYGADPLIRELHAAGRILDVAEHPSIEELSLAADVLVTDYSSLMFDYAVLDRPIVIHAPDWEVYRAMRGTYFDLMEEPPGVVARTDGEVVDALLSGDAAGPAAERHRAAFRERFCPWDDGRAAERVVRRVWLGERASAAAPTRAGVR
jgi:CDP-glycerol glycerophosphotransferase